MRYVYQAVLCALERRRLFTRVYWYTESKAAGWRTGNGGIDRGVYDATPKRSAGLTSRLLNVFACERAPSRVLSVVASLQSPPAYPQYIRGIVPPRTVNNEPLERRTSYVNRPPQDVNRPLRP